jgi:hypothetical protein
MNVHETYGVVIADLKLRKNHSTQFGTFAI